MNDTGFVILSLCSVFFGLLSALIFSLLLSTNKAWLKAAIKAPTYGLFLGFGIVGGGVSDTGFALPAPVIPAYLTSEPSDRFKAAVCPFLVWTLLFFTYECIKYGWMKKKKSAN